MGLFFGLVPVIAGFLAGDGDWVSPAMTGMRDGMLVARAVGLGSIKKMKDHFHFKNSITSSWQVSLRWGRGASTHPIVDYAGMTLHPKGVPFPEWRYIKWQGKNLMYVNNDVMQEMQTCGPALQLA